MRVLEHDATSAEPAADADITAPIVLPREQPGEHPDGRPRVPALDGLRGLAMVLVVLSHLWIVMPEGFLSSLGPFTGLFRSGSHGVTVFFVIGGFLVTSSLLAEHDRQDRNSVRTFWRRRLPRVGGPLLALLVTCGVVWWAEGFAPSTPRASIDTLAASATFTSNWLFLDRPLDVRPELGHLWYLAVEQQFYVVWVVALAALARRRRMLAAIAGGGAIAVVLWRLAVWYEAGWYEATLRTDTRIDGLLIGALLALLVAAGRLRSAAWLTPVGLGGMAAVVLSTGSRPAAYLGLQGIVFLAASFLAVAGLISSPGRAGTLLGARPLRWLGAVSYPTYLWHLPIFYAFARWGRDWPLGVRLAAVALTLVVTAGLTRRWVERPILERLRGARPVRSPADRFTRSAAIGAVVGAVPFLMVLWDFGIRPLRTASATRVFSNFYDLQARALMDGHLHVPTGSLSIEAFRIGGRDFMYFPPLPAVLRIPLFTITDEFDGRLSAISMLVAWLLLVVFAAALIWRVRCLLRPGRELSRRENFALGTLVAVVGGGSVVTFVAGLPWVYHEAYMWSTATAVGTTWAIIGVLERPSAGRIVGAGGLALATILSRTTAGWAMCLGLLLGGAVVALAPRWRESRIWAGPILAAGAAPLLVGAAINWAKFRHPYMFPLGDQVWTELNEQRQEALARNGGSLTGLQFFPTSLVNYFRPTGIRFTPIFPFITLPAEPAEAVGGAFLDQRYRTGSVPAFMPLLTGLSVVGVVMLVRRGADEGHRLLRVPAFAAAAVAAGVMAYGYVAHRYTAEFLPGLVVLGAVGLFGVGAWARRWSPVRRSVAATVFIALAAFSILANTAIGFSAAREMGRGEALQRLVDARLTVSDWSGNPADRYVEVADDLSDVPPTDTLRVVADCRGVYLSSGDLYEPWITVDARGVEVDVTVSGIGDPGRTPLVEFRGAVKRAVLLDHDGFGNYRLLVEGGGSEAASDWFLFDPGTTFSFTVRPWGEQLIYLIDAPAYLYTSVPMSDWSEDWIGVPSRIDLPEIDRELAARRGARIERRWLPPSALCTRLLDAAGAPDATQ